MPALFMAINTNRIPTRERGSPAQKQVTGRTLASEVFSVNGKLSGGAAAETRKLDQPSCRPVRCSHLFEPLFRCPFVAPTAWLVVKPEYQPRPARTKPAVQRLHDAQDRFHLGGQLGHLYSEVGECLVYLGKQKPARVPPIRIRYASLAGKAWVWWSVVVGPTLRDPPRRLLRAYGGRPGIPCDSQCHFPSACASAMRWEYRTTTPRLGIRRKAAGAETMPSIPIPAENAGCGHSQCIKQLIFVYDEKLAEVETADGSRFTAEWFTRGVIVDLNERVDVSSHFALAVCVRTASSAAGPAGKTPYHE